MGRRNEFIDIVLKLFDEKGTRWITTNPLETNDKYEYATPINDLIVIDGRCGARTVLKNDCIAKYVIVSGNKFTFNGILYATVTLIVKNLKTEETSLVNMLSNCESLALRCIGNNNPILPIGGDINFISNPSNHKLVRYIKTTQNGFFLRQEINCNIASQLSLGINNSQIIVTPITPQPPH